MDRGWLRSSAWINRWRLAAIHRGSFAWVVSLGACCLLSKGERTIADSSPTQWAPPLTLHSLVAINWNHWSPSIRTGGRHQLESLVAIDQNRWSPSIGRTGRLQSEPVVAMTWCAHAEGTMTSQGLCWAGDRRGLKRCSFPGSLCPPRSLPGGSHEHSPLCGHWCHSSCVCDRFRFSVRVRRWSSFGS
jgi:hypothetical protein